MASSDIYLHPVARAAWVGMFATALNLLPIGQLDGGHILYSFFPRRHRTISTVVCILLLPLGKFWLGWLIWGVLLICWGRLERLIGGIQRGIRSLVEVGRYHLDVVKVAAAEPCNPGPGNAQFAGWTSSRSQRRNRRKASS